MIIKFNKQANYVVKVVLMVSLSLAVGRASAVCIPCATGFEFASEVMFGHSNLKSKSLVCKEISRTLGCNFKIFGQLKFVQSSLFMVFSTALHFF